MTVSAKIEIISDSGVETDVVASVYNLDPKEAHDTASDLVSGIVNALSGYNPETGAALS